MGYKPDGYTSVAPYLVVGDAARTLEFVHAVFGSEPLRVYHRDDGSIMHAEFRIDDTVVMLGQLPDQPAAHVHIYVDDVDGAFVRAIEAGGTVIDDLQPRYDGDRRGGVCDPSGTVWWLGHYRGAEEQDRSA